MIRRPKRVGCLAFGLAWSLVFVFTNIVFALGDCERDWDTGRCKGTLIRRSVIPAELLVLVGVGWIFYRREMRDGEF